ncbi:MAG TPA: SDR family NAD(P)-dependent oxidoreductase [Puia sp.]
MGTPKIVLLLGANSDVAKEALKLYVGQGYRVIAASRNTEALQEFIAQSIVADERIRPEQSATAGQPVMVIPFDAIDFSGHQAFYDGLPEKPHIVVYAAGWQIVNEAALLDWPGTYRMMNTHYCGAVSILNIIAMDLGNQRLERIVGLSSLSGVRGRKSNFIYGSTKAAFTQYLAGLRQYLFSRNIRVNVIVAGYIRTKMTKGLDLPESLILEPAYIARAIVRAGNGFTIVPGFKWKIIYWILKLLPERLVAKLP